MFMLPIALNLAALASDVHCNRSWTNSIVQKDNVWNRSIDQSPIYISFHSLLFLLRKCANTLAITETRRTHALILVSGRTDRYLSNLLIDLYAKCACINDARVIFDQMVERNVFSWNIIIAAYSYRGFNEEALQLFEQMHAEGVILDKCTFCTVLKTCAETLNLKEGQKVHKYIIGAGLESDVVVGTALVNMYGKCGRPKEAWEVFEKINGRNIVSWNAMIAATAYQGSGKYVIQLLWRMRTEGMRLNAITCINALGAFYTAKHETYAKLAHAYVLDERFDLIVFVSNALVTMYGKCGALDSAKHVFDQMNDRNVVSWTALITAHVQNDDSARVLQLFKKMQDEQIVPTKTTYISLLDACSVLANLQEGRRVHALVVKAKFESDCVVGTSLVNMYGKCKSVMDAQMAFGKLAEQDTISWNSMIVAYVQNGHSDKAICLYQEMPLQNVMPDSITIASILDACANIACLSLGKHIHAEIMGSFIESEVVVGNSLVNMYGRCGRIEDAKRMFGKMHVHNIVSWSAMVATFAQNGCTNDAFQSFQQMQCEGIMPDQITLVSIMFSCSHAGLVNQGCHHFVSMTKEYGVHLTIDHHACMVGLLGRAGWLAEAQDVVMSMLVEPINMLWMALIAACTTHDDLIRAMSMVENVSYLELTNQSFCLLQSSKDCTNYCLESKLERQNLIGGRHVNMPKMKTGAKEKSFSDLQRISKLLLM